MMERKYCGMRARSLYESAREEWDQLRMLSALNKERWTGSMNGEDVQESQGQVLESSKCAEGVIRHPKYALGWDLNVRRVIEQREYRNGEHMMFIVAWKVTSPRSRPLRLPRSRRLVAKLKPPTVGDYIVA
jgi:hypothetical protein